MSVDGLRNAINFSANNSQTNLKNQAKGQQTSNLTAPQFREEFVKVKRDNGLIRKFYNFLKNSTGLGLGSRKIENEIDKFEQGEISESQVRETIDKYKVSQENALQTAGDLTAAATTMGTFYSVKNFAAKNNARIEINAHNKILRDIIDSLKDLQPEKAKTIEKMLHISNKKLYAVMLPLLAIIGGFTKTTFTQLERIGSKEYTADKTDKSKAEYKQEKKKLKHDKFKSNLKAFGTGALSGILAPVTTIAGGVVGIPAYVAALTGLEYTSNKHEKNKSVKGFASSFIDNGIFNTLGIATLGFFSFKKVHYSKILDKNLAKVVEKFKDKKLVNPELGEIKTAYKELEETMLESDSIKSILNNSYAVSIDDTIKALIDENIFAAKFLQIRNSGKYADVTKALKSDCPTTRTMEEAQQYITQKLGKGYTVNKLLGVGTVAETYLAKGADGKEVCIKILKKGMNAEKIKTDKEKFINLITKGETPENLTQEQKYLIKNIEDLASGISKEVDFVNEMNAAKELAKYTKTADVVVPIKAVDGAYVMEKAPGISVATLVDYYKASMELKMLGKFYTQEQKAAIEAKIKRIKSKSPDFEDFELSTKQVKKLLNQYIMVQTEQFHKIFNGEKVIHADIHPENIFINLEALKTDKGKLFTLIDTGNTIKLTKEQSKQALRLTAYIKNGNVKDLTDVVLDGAALPKGLTKEQAAKLVEKDLKELFFDNNTKIETMNIDSFYALSDCILRKHNIIPNNTQLNLNKAKTSSQNSFMNLLQSFFSQKYGDRLVSLNDKFDLKGAMATAGSAAKEIAQIKTNMELAKTKRETMNLFNMSLKEAFSFLRNKNMLKPNSEEHLTYKFKQDMPGPKREENISEMFSDGFDQI